MQDNRKRARGRRSINGVVSLGAPRNVLQAKCQPYVKHGALAHRNELIHQSVFDIVSHYQSVYLGLVNFYRMAHNLRDVAHPPGIMRELTHADPRGQAPYQ